MPETDPTDAPVRAPDTSLTTSKVTAVAVAAVEAHDTRIAQRAQLHPVAQVFDQIGDWIAVLGLTYACIGGRLSGELLLVGVCVVLGVQTGLRRGLGPPSMPRAGALALFGLGLAHVVSAVSASGGSPGYMRVPGWYARLLKRARPVAHRVAVEARALWEIARLRWLVCLACLALAALLAGCPLPPADGCTPLATRCSPDGVPQSCSPTQRWTSGALQRPCSSRAAAAVCCRTRSPYGAGGETHACVPVALCIPETSAPDAGAEAGDQ